MWFEQVMFFIAAFGALGGALGVVILRNPFYSVLALVAHLISLAVLFLLLRAEFLAAAQVLVYAGAVMVLYVFVVAYIGGVHEPLGEARGLVATMGPLFAVLLLVELMFALIGGGLSALGTRGAHVPPGFGSPVAIGQLLLQRFLIPFEAASYLLLLAAVGAVVLARRRRGLEELGGDELPERRGQAPMGERGGDGSRPIPDPSPTRIPAGTQEGPGDPAITRDPGWQTQERDEEGHEEEVTEGSPAT